MVYNMFTRHPGHHVAVETVQLAIEIFCSRGFSTFFCKKKKKWQTNMTLMPGQLRKLIDSDSGEYFVDFEAAETNEATSTLEFFRERILESMSNPTCYFELRK